MRRTIQFLLCLALLLILNHCNNKDNPQPTVLIPVVSSIEPTSGTAGTSVTITGKNFDPLPENNVVTFNGTVAKVMTATSTSLDVEAPAGSTGAITITTSGGNATGPVFTYLQPAKKWRLRSVIYSYSSSALQHIVYFYNDRGMIVKIGRGLSGIKDTLDIGIQEYVDYTYDSIDRVKFMKPNQAPGFKFIHLSPYEIQVYSYPHYASDAVGTFNFNGHGHDELDSYFSVILPGNLFAGKSTRSYNYNDAGGVQSQTDIETNLTDGSTTSQDEWAFSGSGLSSTVIANPFKELPLEQRLIHYSNPLFRFPNWDMLGPAWSIGIFESYTYKSGTKEVAGYFGNNYKVDSNGNVIAVTSYVKTDPNSNWQISGGYWLSYEQY